VYAFEPVDAAFLQLKKVKELNPGLDITIEELAIGHKNCKTIMRIWRNQKSPGSYLPREGFEPRVMTKEAVEVEVNMVKLDSYVIVKKINRIDMIKIDVEGWEAFVLQGARECIRKYKPIIICEISNDIYTGKTIELIEAIRQECGYKIKFADGTAGNPVDIIRRINGAKDIVLYR
jgi:FkbM family methyltransferase